MGVVDRKTECLSRAFLEPLAVVQKSTTAGKVGREFLELDRFRASVVAGAVP
jgi:hypothetical protein